MKEKILIFLIFFQTIFSFEYTYNIKNIKNISDPLAKIPICIGDNQDNIKCSEIPIDLTYPYVLISPKLYSDKSIKDIKGADYTQDFINYNYYFYKGIKYQSNYFLKKENIYIKGNNTKLNYIFGLQDVSKIGLGPNFEKEKLLENGEHIYSDYNFINYLNKNNFINDYIFSFEPKSKTETIISIGERINTNYKKCFSTTKLNDIVKNFDQIEEKGFWNCPLIDITTTNLDKHFLNNEKTYVVFDSISDDIHLPHDIGMEILNYINDITGNKCYFEEKSFSGPSKKEYSYTYLVCKFGVDMSKLPDFNFIFEGFELKMGKNVLLRYHDCGKNRVNILAYRNLRYIRIGIPILKQYHIIFDYKDGSVGIVQDKSYLFDEIRENKINYYYIVIIILILSAILLSLRIRKKKKKNNRIIDYENNSNELISK